MDFKDSKTKENLMRAFAGESQARNRYTIAAKKAAKDKHNVLERVFLFTADQEREHARIFYDLLKDANGENIQIDGAYPVNDFDGMLELLQAAEHGENEEFEDVYPAFAKIAEEEGFMKVAAKFRAIAQIEKTHAERFAKFAELVEEGRLYVSDMEEGWVCLNCGYVSQGKEAPKVCPVCEHEQGYFIRISMVPMAAGVTQ